MEGVPATIGTSGNDGFSSPPPQPPPQPPPHVNGGGGGEVGDSISGGFTEEGDRNSAGNRWPKQETLALIKIRSDMDAAFRDSNIKGPLWDDVSRKLSELGFHRSAKKCREKFENVYKYHRRTKEGRTSKSDKTYRFFDQLQALESSPRGAFPPLPPPAAMKPPTMFAGMSNSAAIHPVPVTVPSFSIAGSDQNNVSPISVAAPAVPPLPAMNHKRSFPFSQPNMSGSTNSDESYTSSDEEPPRKKRKWQEFFGKLMNEVIEKQEELQMKFLDALERRERDRVAREEAWRAQEIAKMNQEHERLVKERSIAAAKDAAVITLLQKMTGKTPDAVAGIFPAIQQQQPQIQKPPLSLPPPPSPSPHHQVLPTVAVAVPVSVPPPPPAAIPVAPPAIQVAPPAIQVAPPGIPSMAPPVIPVSPPMVKNLDGGAGEIMLSPSPSRWPKAEINALINLRTQLDTKYQENVPKGPLWEDISAAMRKLGYNRNAKRCKEKWENINKYYKKMKEGNKKRPEDSKTCPYFHQLDAIYSGKANNNSETKMTAIVARPEQQWPPAGVMPVQEKAPAPQQQQRPTDPIYMDKVSNNLGFSVKPETQITPVGGWPQQQWLAPTVVQEAPRQPPHQQQSTAGADDQGSGNDDYDDDDDDEEDDDDDEDDGGDDIFPNKTSSMAAV